MPRSDEVMRFDPAGHKRLSTGTDGMRKCKVRICELMTAGVVLSRLIATRQKLKFVLGRVIAAFPKYAKVFLLASNVRFGIWNVGIRDVNLSLLSLSFYFRPL